MTSAFDDRLVRVGIDIDGELTTYENLRIEIRGTKWRSALMSTCEVKIYNLTREHRQYILTKASPIRRPPAQLTPITITVDIGRKSYGTFRLFEGAVFQGGVSQPPDIGIVLSSLTDNFLLANTGSTSMGEYSTLQQIASKIASDMGKTLLMKSDRAGAFIGNYSFTGSPQMQMDKLNQMGVIAHIDNGVLIVTDPNQSRSDSVRLINSSTGMVGIPQPTESGCTVRVMADNSIEVGNEVQIESQQNPACNGNYIVMKLDFDIANRDEPFWYMLECLNKSLYTGTQP